MNENRKHETVYITVDIKIYIPDEENIGFWMAINEDNWKTGCVLKDEITGAYSVKVLSYIFIRKFQL